VKVSVEHAQLMCDSVRSYLFLRRGLDELVSKVSEEWVRRTYLHDSYWQQ
jgi:hypothetical protein